jgi:hypothetical protein
LSRGRRPGVRRAARWRRLYLRDAVADTIARLRSSLADLRAGFGRTGDFPLYTQVSAPATSDDARTLVQSYGEAGVSGLIVSEGATISGVPFLEREGTVRALIESAHGWAAAG